MGNGPLILCSFSLQIWSCLTQVLRAVLAATLPSGCAITRYLYWKQKKCIMHWKIWHQNWLPWTCSTFQIYLYEFENFQGRRMDLFGESRNLCEKGFERIGSIRVECGPWVITPANQICAAAMYVEYLEVKYLPVCLSSWVGYEQQNMTGEMFMLEKGEYPRWDTWSNSYRCDRFMSVRPVRMVSWDQLPGFSWAAFPIIFGLKLLLAWDVTMLKFN